MKLLIITSFRYSLILSLLFLGVGELFTQQAQLVIPIGHTGKIEQLAISADGNSIFSSGGGETIHWDRESGRILDNWSSMDIFVNSISPDGTFLCNTFDSPEITLFQPQTNQTFKFPKQQDDNSFQAFSPDNRYLAESNFKDSVRVWEIETGELTHLLTLPDSGSVSYIDYSPDGKSLLLSYDSSLFFDSINVPKLQIWDLETSEKTFEIQGERSTSFRSVFSPDSKHILHLISDRTKEVPHLDPLQAGKASLIDIASGEELFSFENIKVNHFCMRAQDAVSISADGTRLALINSEWQACIWDLTDGSIEKPVY